MVAMCVFGELGFVSVIVVAAAKGNVDLEAVRFRYLG
jgi:hypothetical protein